MNDKELDEILIKSFKQESTQSPYRTRIDGTIDRLYRKREKRKGFLISIPILLTATVALAVSYNAFNLSSVGIDDTCIELATQNGYIANVDTEVQTYNDLGIKINKFLIDDINLDISYEYTLNNVSIDDIQDVFIQDLYIYDNLNNTIFRENTGFNGVMIGYSKINKISENTFDSTMFFMNNNFPKSEKIYIEFSNVTLHSKNGDKRISGTWKYEIDVPENMKNRESINYEIDSQDNLEKVKIDEVKLTNTGLIVEVIADTEDILNKTKITIISENKKYEANNNLYDVETTSIDGHTKRIYTFNITKYDSPKELSIKVKENHKEKVINIKSRIE